MNLSTFALFLELIAVAAGLAITAGRSKGVEPPLSAMHSIVDASQARCGGERGGRLFGRSRSRDCCTCCPTVIQVKCKPAPTPPPTTPAPAPTTKVKVTTEVIAAPVVKVKVVSTCNECGGGGRGRRLFGRR